MKASTTYNRKTAIDAAFADLWARGAIFGLPFDQMLREAAGIRERLKYGTLSQVARAWLSGRQSLRLEHAYRADIRWTLAERAGRFIEQWDDLSEDERQAFRDGRAHGWHRWAKNDRPFSRGGAPVAEDDVPMVQS